MNNKFLAFILMGMGLGFLLSWFYVHSRMVSVSVSAPLAVGAIVCEFGGMTLFVLSADE